MRTSESCPNKSAAILLLLAALSGVLIQAACRTSDPGAPASALKADDDDDSSPPVLVKEADFFFHYGPVDANSDLLRAGNYQGTYPFQSSGIPSSRSEARFGDKVARTLWDWASDDGSGGVAGRGLYVSSSLGDSASYGPSLLLVERRRKAGTSPDVPKIISFRNISDAAYDNGDMQSLPYLVAFLDRAFGRWLVIPRAPRDNEASSLFFYPPAAGDVERVHNNLHSALPLSDYLQRGASYINAIPFRATMTPNTRIFLDRLFHDKFVPEIRALDLGALSVPELTGYEGVLAALVTFDPDSAKVAAEAKRYARHLAAKKISGKSLERLVPLVLPHLSQPERLEILVNFSRTGQMYRALAIARAFEADQFDAGQKVIFAQAIADAGNEGFSFDTDFRRGIADIQAIFGLEGPSGRIAVVRVVREFRRNFDTPTANLLSFQSQLDNSAKKLLDPLILGLPEAIHAAVIADAWQSFFQRIALNPGIKHHAGVLISFLTLVHAASGETFDVNSPVYQVLQSEVSTLEPDLTSALSEVDALDAVASYSAKKTRIAVERMAVLAPGLKPALATSLREVRAKRIARGQTGDFTDWMASAADELNPAR